MKILAIETSCDDTGITILEAKGGLTKPSFKILADSLASQTIHAEYGGVFPALAKKEHTKNLPILLDKVLKKSKLNKKTKPVDLIAITHGPGLEPALWTGIVFAQELARKWKVPIIPVNHMEGHIFSVFGKNKGTFKISKLKFPILSLLVSGGHTELIVTEKNLKHKIIGRTLDDAAGEAYDKVARMLGLPYPGGPHISKLAEECRKSALRPKQDFSFPRPMLKSKNLDFSFSGLKTAVLYFLKENPNADKSKVAMEFENAVVETLVYKTQKAMKEYNAKTLIVGGGVSANKHLKRELKKITKGKTLLVPTKELSRDNSIMIGMVGYLRYSQNKKSVVKPEKLKAQGDLKLG